jgi:hypothetical protein
VSYTATTTELTVEFTLSHYQGWRTKYSGYFLVFLIDGTKYSSPLITVAVNRSKKETYLKILKPTAHFILLKYEHGYKLVFNLLVKHLIIKI